MSSLDLLAKSIGAKISDGNEPPTQFKQVEEPQKVEDSAVETSEQPTPEVQTDESSLTTGEKPTQTEPINDIESVIRERFDGKFSSLDDIQSALEQSQNQKLEYANETIEQLDKMVREGWSVEEYMELKSKDYDSLDSERLIKEEMKLKDKTLTQEEVDLLYDSEYGYDEDLDNERDIKLKQIKLKKDAEKAKESLNEFREKYMPKSVQEKKATQEQFEAIQKRWIENVDSTKINELVVNDNFKYQVSDDDISSVRSEIKDISKYFEKYVNEDGTENVSKLMEDQLKIKLFDKVVSAAMTTSKSEGREEVITSRDNIISPKDNKPEQEKSMTGQLYQQAKQKGFF